jgi:biotin-(acetyl-CoA carboxylase) ligase
VGEAPPGGLAALSLAGAGGGQMAPAAFLGPVLGRLEVLYGRLEAGETAGFMEAYRALDMTTGQAVTLGVGGERATGRVEGVADSGELVVRTAEGVRHFSAGEVRLDLDS